MNRSLVFSLALFAAACKGKDSTSPNPVPVTIPVAFTGGTITARVAATDSARTAGLMNVSTLGANDGMLFVFGTTRVPSQCGFYMKDTPTSLSIAFIDVNMKVISTDEMAAETLTVHQPPGDCRYAVEANSGWFTSHGIVAGSSVTFSLPAGTIIDP